VNTIPSNAAMMDGISEFFSDTFHTLILPS
jgi:hypothetical protein